MSVTIQGRLPVSLAIMPLETPISFATRFGHANGFSSVGGLCRFMGYKPSDLLGGGLPFIHHLSRLSGVDDVELSKFRFASVNVSGVSIGSHFLGFSRSALMSPRFCPKCVAADIARATATVETAVYMRVNWHLPFMTSCVDHNTPLMSIKPGFKQDFSNFVLANRTSILEAAAEAKPEAPKAFEAYMMKRLTDAVREGHYLDGFSLNDCLPLCQAIGQLSGSGTERLALGMRAEAREIGFLALTDGELTLRSVLSNGALKSAANAESAKNYFHPLCGFLEPNMNRPEYVALTRLVRSIAMQHFPLGPEDKFLGAVDKRLLHNVSTAASSYGMSRDEVFDVLTENGIETDDFQRLTPNKVIFSAETLHPHLKRASDVISFKEAATTLGVDVWDVFDLASAYRFQPGNKIHRTTMNGDLSKSRIKLWLDRMTDLVTSKKPPTTAARSIPRCARELGASLHHVVDLVLSQRLGQVTRDVEAVGLNSILVDLDEVRTALTAPLAENLTGLATVLRVSEKFVHQLIAEGHLMTTVGFNPTLRRRETFVAPAQLASFQSAYVSLDELACVSGGTKAHIKHMLAQRDFPAISRLSTAAFYRRDDVVALLS